MKSKVIAIICLANILASGLVKAEEEKDFYARQYVNLMHYDEIFDEYLRKCQASMKNMTPEGMLKSNPNYFYGITPNSYYWPEAVEIFQRYYEEACDYMSTTEFVDIFVVEYSKALTVSELKKAIEFYKSNVGIKLRDTHILANSTFQSLANKRSAENTERANERFMKRITELGKRYKRDPK